MSAPEILEQISASPDFTFLMSRVFVYAQHTDLLNQEKIYNVGLYVSFYFWA